MIFTVCFAFCKQCRRMWLGPPDVSGLCPACEEQSADYMEQEKTRMEIRKLRREPMHLEPWQLEGMSAIADRPSFTRCGFPRLSIVMHHCQMWTVATDTFMFLAMLGSQCWDRPVSNSTPIEILDRLSFTDYDEGPWTECSIEELKQFCWEYVPDPLEYTCSQCGNRGTLTCPACDADGCEDCEESGSISCPCMDQIPVPGIIGGMVFDLRRLRALLAPLFGRCWFHAWSKKVDRGWNVPRLNLRGDGWMASLAAMAGAVVAGPLEARMPVFRPEGGGTA